MTKLIKASLTVGSTEIALILINIARSKYLALTIGADGLGLYSILNSFFTLVSAFCGGWFVIAFIKFISLYHNHKKASEEKIYNAAFSIITLLLIIIVVTLCLFKNKFKNIFLTPEILDFHYSIFISIFIITSFKNIYSDFLYATFQTKLSSKVKILSSIVEVFCILILVYFFHLNGFFISLLISIIFSLFILKYYTKNSIKAKIQFNNLFTKESKDLVKLGSKNIPLLVINNFSQYFFRIIILNSLSIGSVGIFQAMNTMTGYVGVFNRGANADFVPSMNNDLTINKLNEIFDTYFKFNLIIGTFITIISIFFIDNLIGTFFSSEFLVISKYSHIFLIAQFLNMFVLGLQAIVLGTNKYKWHYIGTIISNTIWIIFPLIFINKIGINSIGYSLIISNSFIIAYNYYKLKKYIYFSIKSKNIIVFILTLFCLVVASIFKNYSSIYKISITAITFIIFFFFLSKREKIKIFITAKKFNKLIWLK